jgi:S-adenosylmethionine:tRNA ribosyltransferase-isomerase
VASSPDAAGSGAGMGDGSGSLTTSAFDYELPVQQIAHYPTAERDASRLLVVRRDTTAFEHRTFRDIAGLFEAGDVLVLNETRVIPARLLGSRPGGGAAEIVLLHPAHDHAGLWAHEWIALVRPGPRLRAGRTVSVGPDLDVHILDVLPDGNRRVRLITSLPVRTAIERYGRLPLPPYIDRAVEEQDAQRYQTVYARQDGSVAAPTAGLHFTPAVLDTLRQRGVVIATIVLHVGVGTFRPVEVEDPAEHVMHPEWYEVTRDQAEIMNRARARGGKLWAVGTTVTRTLETVVRDAPASEQRPAISPVSGWTDLFIRPGYSFRAVDRLITNFHLPRSTLLMLVSAFAGHERTMRAYREAVSAGYRFYSYGDAMVIL